MTDNDKTALDAAIHETAVKIGHPTYAEVDWFKSGFSAALAHAEAQHAKRVKVLVDAMESIPYYAYGDNEAAVQMMDMVQEFTKTYRGKE